MKSKLVLIILILTGVYANAENWTNYPVVTKPGSTNDTFLLGSISAHTNQQLKAGDLLSWTKTNIYVPTTNQYAYFNSAGQLVGTNNGTGLTNLSGVGGGGAATNAIVGISTNSTAVLAAGATNLNFTTSLTLTGGVVNGTVTIGIPTGLSTGSSNRFTGIVNFAGAIMVEATNTPGIDFNYAESTWSTNNNWNSTLISGAQRNRRYTAYWTNTSPNQITNTLVANENSINDSNAVITVVPIPGLTVMRVSIRTDAATNFTIEYFGANNFTIYSIAKAAGTATAGQMLLSDGAGRYTNATPSVGSVSSAGSNVFFYAVDGTYLGPGYTFASATNTGMWLEPGAGGSNSLHFGINGGVDNQETFMRIYPGIVPFGPRLQIYGDVEMIAGARFFQSGSSSSPSQLASWDSTGALNTSGIDMVDISSLTNLLNIYATNTVAGQTVVSDGAGGFTSGSGGSGGSATNLTPWPSDINGAAHGLTNVGDVKAINTIGFSRTNSSYLKDGDGQLQVVKRDASTVWAALGAQTRHGLGLAGEGGVFWGLTYAADTAFTNPVAKIEMTTPGNLTITTNLTVTGSITGNVMNVINVLQYGANPNDTGDSTAAIQAALNAATNAPGIAAGIGGRRVFIPAGTYQISGLHIPPYVTLEGEHSSIGMGTRLVLSTLATNFSRIALMMDATGGQTIKNIRLNSDLANTAGTVGIRSVTNGSASSSSPYVILEGVHVNGYTEGIFLNYCWNWDIYSCYTANCRDGIVMSNTVNSSFIFGGQHDTHTHGIKIIGDSCNGITIQTTIENCTYGIYSTNSSAGGVNGLNIEDTYFESNTDYDIYLNGNPDAILKPRIIAPNFHSSEPGTNIFMNDVYGASLIDPSYASATPVQVSIKGLSKEFNYTSPLYAPGVAENIINAAVSSIRIGPTNVTVTGGNISVSGSLYIGTNTVSPSPLGTGGWLWNSNKVLFWITNTKTNIVVDGR